MECQLPPHEGLVDRAQSRDGDGADIDARACRHGVGHVDRVLRGVLEGCGHRHLGEGVAFVEKGGLQPGAGGQNIIGAGGLPALQLEGGAGGGRHCALDRYAAEVKQRTAGERDDDRNGRGGGISRDLRGQAGVVDRLAVDRDADAAVVVAGAIEHRLQPVLVGARAEHEGEGTGRRFQPQRCEVRGRGGQRVERLVAGFDEGDGIGLRICGTGRRGKDQRRSGRRGPGCVARPPAPERTYIWRQIPILPIRRWAMLTLVRHAGSMGSWCAAGRELGQGQSRSRERVGVSRRPYSRKGRFPGPSVPSR